MLIELTMVLVIVSMVLWILIPEDVKHFVMYLTTVGILSFVGFVTCVLILSEYNSVYE